MNKIHDLNPLSIKLKYRHRYKKVREKHTEDNNTYVSIVTVTQPNNILVSVNRNYLSLRNSAFLYILA